LILTIGKIGVAQNTASPGMFDAEAAQRFANLASRASTRNIQTTLVTP